MINILFISFVAVCLFGFASAGADWGEYLKDVSLPPHADLDGEERKPLFLREPERTDCERFKLEDMLGEPGSQNNPQSPNEVFRQKTVSFCKQTLEKDITDNLAKLDVGLKERVNFLIDNMIKANGGKGFSEYFSMPAESVARGVLTTLEQRGTDLSSIKTQNQLVEKYKVILKDCNELQKNLDRDTSVYSIFLKRKELQSEPIVGLWTRNTIVCGILRMDESYYCDGAYRMLNEGAKQAGRGGQIAPNNGGKRVSILKRLTKKS